MHYVIAGSGAAGVAAAQTLRRLDQASQITLISEEDKLGYYRPLISHLIHDTFPEERFLRAPDLFADLKVEVLSPIKAEAVDPERKMVRTSRDHMVPYDKLLLATGSMPVLPQIKGANNKDFHTLRFYWDGVKMAKEARPGKKALIVGGGRIGILTALALREANLEVTVVEMLSHVLPQQFDTTAAAIVSPAIEAKGIRLLMGHQVKEIKHKLLGGKVAILDDGQELPFDLLVAAVGVRPNLELAQQMGVKVDRGVVVDETMQTSLPNVFAAGDIVQLVDRATGQEFVSGTWTNAVDMGNCAAYNMAGIKRQYAGSFFIFNAVEIAGLPTVAVGAIQGSEPEYEVHSQCRDSTYHKFVFQGNRLVGMLLVGDVDKAGIYRTLIREGSDISQVKDKIISKTLTYAAYQKQPIPETTCYST